MQKKSIEYMKFTAAAANCQEGTDNGKSLSEWIRDSVGEDVQHAANSWFSLSERQESAAPVAIMLQVQMAPAPAPCSGRHVSEPAEAAVLGPAPGKQEGLSTLSMWALAALAPRLKRQHNERH